jgi:HD-GYP domain-containing protein (c-di-GMP phosphodiesterase class II)
MNSINAQEARYEDHLLTISAAIDEFEGYAQPHGRRVAIIADALAQKFNFAAHDSQALGQAALVHDAGELMMNRDYIKANRVLRDEERVDMQRHTVIGEQEAAKRGLSRAVQLLVRWHHEWWNGGGYPDALVGEQIPLAARILRVADTYASMTAARPHRAAISAAEAKRYLIEWAGIEFDPRIVKYFLLLNSDNYESRITNYESKEQIGDKLPEERPIDEPEIKAPQADELQIAEPQINERQDTNEGVRNEQSISESPISEQQVDNHPFQNQSISESQIAERQADEQKINS